MLRMLQILDLTPYGRPETWEDSPAGWPQETAGSWRRREIASVGVMTLFPRETPPLASTTGRQVLTNPLRF
jgi:hypothetical protein